MEVRLDPDLETKLSRIAEERGRPTVALIHEAIERWVDYDEWFSSEVDRGVSAADSNDFVEHDAVRKLIDVRYPG